MRFYFLKNTHVEKLSSARVEARELTSLRRRALHVPQGEDTFGLSADNHWTMAVALGELLLYAANSAALATRSAGAGTDAAPIQRAALALADAVRVAST